MTNVQDCRTGLPYFFNAIIFNLFSIHSIPTIVYRNAYNLTYILPRLCGLLFIKHGDVVIYTPICDALCMAWDLAGCGCACVRPTLRHRRVFERACARVYVCGRGRDNIIHYALRRDGGAPADSIDHNFAV